MTLEKAKEELMKFVRLKTTMWPEFASVLTSADVQEVKHGNWVGIDDFPHEIWECNRCGRIIEGDRENYCPNCGASMMDEVEQDG